MVWTWVWRAVRIVQMHAGKQGVGSAIEKLHGNVSAGIEQQAVIAHPKGILCAEAVWVPAIDRSHRTRIGRDKRGEREDAVAVIAAARRQGGKHGMAQPREDSLAFATVVQRIFLEGFCQRITRRCPNRCAPKVRSESPGITLHALIPLWRRIACLVDTGNYRCAGNWVRA